MLHGQKTIFLYVCVCIYIYVQPCCPRICLHRLQLASLREQNVMSCAPTVNAFSWGMEQILASKRAASCSVYLTHQMHIKNGFDLKAPLCPTRPRRFCDDPRHACTLRIKSRRYIHHCHGTTPVPVKSLHHMFSRTRSSLNIGLPHLWPAA